MSIVTSHILNGPMVGFAFGSTHPTSPRGQLRIKIAARHRTTGSHPDISPARRGGDVGENGAPWNSVVSGRDLSAGLARAERRPFASERSSTDYRVGAGYRFSPR
jgi:hypothetical protein